jgi:hypothetical protein
MARVEPCDIYQYLRERQVPRIHAIGILANIQGESNFDPGINEVSPLVRGSRGGYGLFQHTGPRRRALESYCRSRSLDVWNWRAQVDFAFTEHETTLYLKRKFPDARAATDWWVRYWERPAHPDRASARRQASVRAFEARCRDDGSADSSEPQPDVQRMLRQGDRGEDVKKLQRLLFEPDGIFGHRTARAVRRFQAAHGLDPDGIVGPQTFKRLKWDELD